MVPPQTWASEEARSGLWCFCLAQHYGQSPETFCCNWLLLRSEEACWLCHVVLRADNKALECAYRLCRVLEDGCVELKNNRYSTIHLLSLLIIVWEKCKEYGWAAAQWDCDKWFCTAAICFWHGWCRRSIVCVWGGALRWERNDRRMLNRTKVWACMCVCVSVCE